MTPDRKRQVRLYVSLTAAVLLAGALIYTSFSAGTSERQPSELLASDEPGKAQLVGRVASGSVEQSDDELRFRVEDLESPETSVAVVYSGQVPDPFKPGREVLVTGNLSGTEGSEPVFAAERDSLITKCPSKFTAAAEKDPEHVIIED